MADLGIHFINTPFGYEPYEPGITMSLSGCVFAQTAEFPDSILVETLDMHGGAVADCPPLDLRAGVVFQNLNPIISPGLPAMYYAFPNAPKVAGSYQIRVTVRYPSGSLSPRMRTIRVFDSSTGGATARAADLDGDVFRLAFENPRSGARLAALQPIPVSCVTKITRRSVYGYFLAIDETTELIAASGFHRSWLLRDHDCQMNTVLKLPSSAQGPHSIVCYLLAMNQGAIQESKTLPIVMQAVATPSARGVTRSAAVAKAAKMPFAPGVPDLRLDLNRASASELTNLPGVGRTLAKRIVNARPFKSIEELAEVERFPESRLVEFGNFVTIADA